MKVGDLVRRVSHLPAGPRSSSTKYEYGIVVKIEHKSQKHLNKDPLNSAHPIRLVMVLTSKEGLRIWYGIHTEVVNEC